MVIDVKHVAVVVDFPLGLISGMLVLKRPL